MTDVKVLDLQDYKIQKDYRPHTAYKIMSFLNHFLNYCIKRGYFDYFIETLSITASRVGEILEFDL